LLNYCSKNVKKNYVSETYFKQAEKNKRTSTEESLLASLISFAASIHNSFKKLKPKN
jgi:hypothetical protein